MNVPINECGTSAYGFIYITTNLINGKRYIGQRKIQREYTDNRYLGSGTLLLKDIKTYGRENFNRDILEWVWTREDLNDREKYYISFYNAVDDPMFYNVLSGGQDNPEFTEDMIRRRSESLKKTYKQRPELRMIAIDKMTNWNNSNAGRLARIENGIKFSEFCKNNPDKVKQRIQKTTSTLIEKRQNDIEYKQKCDAQIKLVSLKNSIYPIVCNETNEVYAGIAHVSKWIGHNSAQNIKKHISGDSKYKYCGRHPETGEKLTWRLATLEDFYNLPYGKGGEEYEQLCREFLERTSGRTV